MTNATSKEAIAAAVFASMTAFGHTRKEILPVMIERTGLTEAGAATYFNNFRKGVWSLSGAEVVQPTEAAAPVVEAIDFASKTSKELVALYNERAAKPVVKFRDHATAVRRVTELYAA